jgi:hypothetical protein
VQWGVSVYTPERIFRRWSEGERGSVLLFVAGECYYSIGLTVTLLFVFSCEALAFWLLQAFLKAFQLYLSIKYTALSLFCFRACPFFSSIYPSTNSSTLFSFPYPLSPTLYPPPLTFSLFFFLSSLPSSLSPSSTPPFPFIHGRHTDRFCNSVSSLRF